MKNLTSPLCQRMNKYSYDTWMQARLAYTQCPVEYDRIFFEDSVMTLSGIRYIIKDNIKKDTYAKLYVRGPRSKF